MWGSWEGAASPSSSVRGSGEHCKLRQGSGEKIWIMEHFGTLKITSEWSASFRIWEATSESGGRGQVPPCPNVEPLLGTVRYDAVYIYVQRETETHLFDDEHYPVSTAASAFSVFAPFTSVRIYLLV